MSTAAPPAFDQAAFHRRRQQISTRFLKGSGVEIGALHQPLALPRGVKITYVDRMSVDDLRKHYPELNHCPLTPVDRIDDGEHLHTFRDASLDFIVANHMLEHCENPLGTLRSHLRKVKPRGVLYYAIPDKRYTFDIARSLTPWEHLLTDDREGPAHSRWDHFLDWTRNVLHALPADAEPHARGLEQMNYSIHFHVWDFDHFRDFLSRAATYLGGFTVELLEQNQMEAIAILRRV